MGRRKKKTLFEESAMLNSFAYELYRDRLSELAVSSFGYENMPASVDIRYLEMTLLLSGNAVYFNDEVEGNLTLGILPGGNFDVYGNPVIRRAYSRYNNYQKELTREDSVIIWNNYQHTNSISTIEYYARKLAHVDRIIDVNLNAQKTPVIIKCSEQQRLTMMNLYKEYDGNAPFIFGDDSLNTDGMAAYSTKAEFNADKMYTIKQLIWNEVLTYLGIANVEVTKKERLITDEVNRNLGGTFACRFSRLNSRVECFDKVNSMFGTNIKPFFREITPEEMNMPTRDLEKEPEDKEGVIEIE